MKESCRAIGALRQSKRNKERKRKITDHKQAMQPHFVLIVNSKP